jgi:glycosyltransferase involved in cell wall biosynthesis
LGIQQEVKDSQSGLLFPYGNSKKLAEAIEKLIVDIDFRTKLEQNATRYVQNLSFENHFEKLQTIYEKVLKNEF